MCLCLAALFYTGNQTSEQSCLVWFLDLDESWTEAKKSNAAQIKKLTQSLEDLETKIPKKGSNKITSPKDIVVRGGTIQNK